MMKQKIKKIIARIIVLSGAYSPKRATVVKKFKNIYFNLYRGKKIDEMILAGEYDPEILFLYDRLLKRGDVFIDIGANLGIHTVYAANIVGKDGKVFSFEPVDHIIKKMKMNIALNSLSNVEIVPKVVGEKNGQVEFHQIKENNKRLGVSSVFKNDNFKLITDDGFVKIKADMITLDDFVSGKNIDTISLIKMDIEGYELFALKGAQNTIKTKKPIIIMEHNQNRLKEVKIDENQIKEALPGYDFYEICSPTSFENYVSLEPFNFNRKLNFSNLLCVPRV